MATGTIMLPIEGASLPTGDTGNAFPAIGARETDDATAPQIRLWVAHFDDTVVETFSFMFRLPGDYASGGTVKIQFYMVSATAGDIIWAATLQAVTPGDATDMESLDPDGEGGGWSSDTEGVPGTAGYLDESSIAISSMDSAAAGDYVCLNVQRDADNGGDDATGDAVVVAMSFEYVTT